MRAHLTTFDEAIFQQDNESLLRHLRKHQSILHHYPITNDSHTLGGLVHHIKDYLEKYQRETALLVALDKILLLCAVAHHPQFQPKSEVTSDVRDALVFTE